MHYVYILLLADNSYYVGYSGNLKQRIRTHVEGLVKETKNRRPVTLVFYAAFRSKQKALTFEKYLKSGSGFAFRNKHLIE